MKNLNWVAFVICSAVALIPPYGVMTAVNAGLAAFNLMFALLLYNDD